MSPNTVDYENEAFKIKLRSSFPESGRNNGSKLMEATKVVTLDLGSS
jgi:hypothetical protein